MCTSVLGHTCRTNCVGQLSPGVTSKHQLWQMRIRGDNVVSCSTCATAARQMSQRWHGGERQQWCNRHCTSTVHKHCGRLSAPNERIQLDVHCPFRSDQSTQNVRYACSCSAWDANVCAHNTHASRASLSIALVPAEPNEHSLIASPPDFVTIAAKRTKHLQKT